MKTRGTPIVPDPAEIQQQIEGTRAELASTIDAIADRLSPKHVAARTVETVKGKVDDLRSHGTALPSASNGQGAITSGAAGPQQPLPDRVKAHLIEAKETKGKSVRWDRVGVVVAVIGALAFLKSRRGR